MKSIVAACGMCLDELNRGCERAGQPAKNKVSRISGQPTNRRVCVVERCERLACRQPQLVGLGPLKRFDRATGHERILGRQLSKRRAECREDDSVGAVVLLS